MTDKISTKMRRLALCAVPLVLVWNIAAAPARAQDAAAPAPAQSQSQNQQSFSQAQIAQLVAPIALYPDPLLTQILMASTYPLEVVEAARWSRDNPSVTGQALENAMQDQSWDPSVKALTTVPQTLEMMSNKLAWTEELGDAFLAQQQDVLAAVQTLRAEAQAAGNLKSTPQQVVTTEPAPAGVAAPSGRPPIVIEPVNPGVYYVPIYNPAVVYGAWGYPDYPPFYWSPPGFIASNIVSFSAGVAVGAAIWGGCNWWNHNVIINVNRYNIFNHTNINITNNVWEHNPAHRGNVPYRNAALAERFGQSNEAAARETLRDRVDVPHDNLFKDRPDARQDDALRDRANAQRDDILKDRPDIQRDRPDAQREDALRRAEGDAERGRAMPERRNAAPPRDVVRRQIIRPRVQNFRPERRAMGGGFHFHGGDRHRL
jgi:Protein of unknown function (DUF3300)